MNTPYKMDKLTKRYKWKSTPASRFQLFEKQPDGRYISIDVYTKRGNAQRERDRMQELNPTREYIIVGIWE